MTKIGRNLKKMRMWNFLLALLVTASLANADVVQVPVTADGSTDLDKVLDNFRMVFPVYSNGVQPTDFTGEMLGEVFSGRVFKGDIADFFFLSIDAPTLSEHAHFLVAVLATDVICLQNDLSPGPVLWQETKVHNGTAWEVSTSCTTPRNQTSAK